MPEAISGEIRGAAARSRFRSELSIRAPVVDMRQSDKMLHAILLNQRMTAGHVLRLFPVPGKFKGRQ
jgi:hypothetical protein